MIGVVFRKEVREMFRDRRVIVGAFIVPILLIAFMIRMVGSIESSVTTNRASQIAVLAGTESSVLIEGLKKLPGSSIQTVQSEEEGKQAVRSGEARLFLALTNDFNTKIQSDQAKVQAFHDSSQPLSEIALRTVESVVDEVNRRLAVTELESRGIPEVTLQRIAVDPVDTAKPQPEGTAFLASLLPYMIVLWAFYGGVSSVSDMMAGEKERGTLETLLLSPVSRREIAWGKALALGLICLLSSLSAVVGVLLSSVLAGEAVREFQLDAMGAVAILAQVLPLVAMFTAMLFAVSAWAKNMREAQTYLTSVSFIVLVPAIFSNMIGFTGIDRSPWIGWVPILSTGVGLRDALLAKPNWMLVLSSGLVHLAIAWIIGLVVQRLLQRDTILVRV